MNRQVFPRNDAFAPAIHRVHLLAGDDSNIPRLKRQPPAPPLEEIGRGDSARNRATRAPTAIGQYSYNQIDTHFGLHFTTVGCIVREK